MTPHIRVYDRRKVNRKQAGFPGKYTWLTFLKGKAKANADASLLLAIGGRYPGTTHQKILSAAKQGTIDSKSATARFEALHRMEKLYKECPDIQIRDLAIWDSLLGRSGGYRHRKWLCE